VDGQGKTTQSPRDAALRAYEALAPAYDAFTVELDYEPWLVEVLPRLERYGLPGRRLLDVGCGTGESLIPMLDRGWHVLGCDIAPAMIEIARGKVGERAQLEVADMRELPSFGVFDLVWSLNDSVNYLADRAELEAGLEGMRANLRDGGLLVFDLNTLLTYRTSFAERHVVEHAGGRLIWTGNASSEQPPGSICEATFEVEGGLAAEQVESHVHRQRHFPESEVLTALGDAGLRCLGVFGQDKGGVLEQPLDESRHVKALYVARRLPLVGYFQKRHLAARLRRGTTFALRCSVVM
jgi:SAM-dependent methyltransferase